MDREKTIYQLLLLLVFFLGAAVSVHAQVNELRIKPPDELNRRRASEVNRDTVRTPQDTLPARTYNDSLIAGSVSSDFETTINYFAKDSVVNDLSTRVVTLYGDAKIIYGDVELEANNIRIDLETNLLEAEGKLDSLGRRVGYPIFKNGDEVYETKKITYNIKTRQARIQEVVTTQGDGFIHGETVFKNQRDEILSINNTYTTCNLAHPHYRIRSTRTKAIPDDKIVSGPFNLEILDVPTPLGFPFGMFPAPRKSASGIIVPEYGEEARRGFFLRGGGYFFDFNDYIKLSVTGDIYSKGSSGLSLNTNYRKRYRYSGSLSFRVTRNVIPEPIENPVTSNDYSISWSHTPITRGTGSFSASVNAATRTFSQNNFLGVNYDPSSSRLDNTTRNLNSSVSYTKQFRNTPFSMGMSARHTQDLSNGRVDLTLPDFYATMRSIYPFKELTDVEFLRNINLRYNLKSSNQITNLIRDFGGTDQDSIVPFTVDNMSMFLENATMGIQHRIPLSTSFNLSYFNISPSFNYEERWYFEQLRWGLSQDSTRAVVIDTLSGFNRIYDYNMSVGINTRIYGNYIFRNPRIPAMRHIMNPSISYSYNPDFSREKYGFYDEVTVYPTDSTSETVVMSKYDRFVYNRNNIGESQTIGFSLGNTLEIKVLDEMDSTSREDGPQYRKVPIFRRLSVSTGYNLAAERFKFNNISLRANTSLFDNKLSVNMNATIDPYLYNVIDSITEKGDRIILEQERIDVLAITTGSIGRISRAGLQLSTNLNPAKREQEKTTAERIVESDLSEADKNFLLRNPDAYVDFTIPWSLRLNYNLNYSQTGFLPPRITQTLTASGDLSLSEKWKIGFRTGYDFDQKAFTLTSIRIDRDLHCWQMSMDWTPFGRFTSYNFTIRVKSSLLQDLKLNRKRSFFDR